MGVFHAAKPARGFHRDVPGPGQVHADGLAVKCASPGQAVQLQARGVGFRFLNPNNRTPAADRYRQRAFHGKI